MPKLTLRDLFAVMTIVALALGWWVDHRRQKMRQVESKAENERLDAALYRSTAAHMRTQEILIGVAEKLKEAEARDQTSHSK
jgi:hypothetical protein